MEVAFINLWNEQIKLLIRSRHIFYFFDINGLHINNMFIALVLEDVVLNVLQYLNLFVLCLFMIQIIRNIRTFIESGIRIYGLAVQQMHVVKESVQCSFGHSHSLGNFAFSDAGT